MRNPVTGGILDAAWLTDALAPRTQGARVLALEAEPLPVQDALFTGPHRLLLVWDSLDLPGCLIAKAVADDHAAADLGAAMGVFEREAGFYSNLVEMCGVRAPEPWFVWAEPDSTLLVLEDLSELAQHDGREGLAVPEVRSTLEALAAMHARWWGGLALGEHDFLRRADERTFALLDDQCPRLLSVFLDRCAREWDDTEVELISEVAEKPSAFWRPLFEGDVTLVHGDAKPGNLFFDSHGEPVFVDWQATSVASPALDVASLLGCSMPHRVRRDAQADLLAGYLDALRRHGITVDDDEWQRQLRTAAYAMLTPCISAAEVADERLARTLEITARRRADLALSLPRN